MDRIMARFRIGNYTGDYAEGQNAEDPCFLQRKRIKTEILPGMTFKAVCFKLR